jgi:putative FmdB family regulatory protein
MPEYLYRCEAHGNFAVRQPMSESHDFAVCPECQERSRRVFTSPPTHFHSAGFHGRRGHYQGDYDSRGDKLEQLNSGWSKFYGEEPPPPAKQSIDPNKRF